jgi:pimeloyl-ACP methyl ester carboxylesterase
MSTTKVRCEELTWGSCTTYAPMPILFIHGINSNCKTWDDAIPQLEKYFGYRLKKFNKPEEFISYSKPGDPTKGVTWFISQDGKYESPAKLYLEAFDYGGKDSSGGFKYHIGSHTPKLKSEIEKILKAYYGEDNWQNAKLNIIAHSMGGLIARHYIQKADGAKRVKRLITIGTPHCSIVHG